MCRGVNGAGLGAFCEGDEGAAALSSSDHKVDERIGIALSM